MVEYGSAATSILIFVVKQSLIVLNCFTEDEEDALHLLTLAEDGRWIVNNDITYNPQNKKGDLVAIDTKFIPSK